jgi:outer membrane protein assembly factor BamB
MDHILNKLISRLPALVIIAGVAALLFWVAYNPARTLTPSEPGRDAFSAAGANGEAVVIGAYFERFSSRQVSSRENWVRFRGANSDNIYRSSNALINSFNNRVPDILWSVELGEGHAGAAIYDGLVYILDYDEELRSDMLRCFALDTGEEIWRRWYPVQVRRNHGMSRTVPAVTEDYILTLGPRGHIMCVRRETGDLLWGIDLVAQYETEIPLWYTGQCPIIEDGVAIIATGGRALMIAVDCETGEILWETPNEGNWKMSHSSVMPYVFAGRKMYVYSASGGVAGIAADGDDAGTVLWQVSEWNHPVVAASPVCMPDGKIFLTAGYGAGSMMLQLTEQNGNISATVINAFRPGDGLSSEQQTPLLVDGFMFGVMPKDAKTLRNQMVCVRASDPTQVVWSSGPTARFGLGPFILADDKFYLLDDNATLVIIQKSNTGYRELDRVQLFEGHDAWAPLAIADGFMVLRDADKMICINLNR